MVSNLLQNFIYIKKIGLNLINHSNFYSVWISKAFIFISKFWVYNWLDVKLTGPTCRSKGSDSAWSWPCLHASLSEEIKNSLYFRYSLDDLGTLKIAKLDNGKPNSAYFINIGSFYYGIHQNLFFIKVVYPDTVSYVFPHF